MSGYTCPFSRCRVPIDTYEELVAHVDERTKSADDHTHNIDLFTPEDLVAEVRHLVTGNLLLEQSCGQLKRAYDSWTEAYALGKIRGR